MQARQPVRLVRSGCLGRSLEQRVHTIVKGFLQVLKLWFPEKTEAKGPEVIKIT